MRRIQTTGTIFLGAAIALTACGGGPDVESAREHFKNPTGSTQNQAAVAASGGSLSLSNSAISVAGDGIPGRGLTAEGKIKGFNQVSIRRLWERRGRALLDLSLGRTSQGLEEANFSGAGCGDTPEAQQAYQDLIEDLTLSSAIGGALGSSSVSGSASYSLDLSTCSGSQLTGSASYEIKIEVSGDSASFTVKQGFDNVCTTDAEPECLSGSILMEASATSGLSSGSAEFITAWELEATAGAKSASLKGGVRVAATNDSGTLETLIFAKGPDGEEYSFVYTIKATADSATVTIRGSDGELSCSITNEGATGMCTGPNGSITWTAEEAYAEGWNG